MSADNWGICPKCRSNIEESTKSAYGKVSQEEYLALLEKRKGIFENTLREDYEIFTDADGLFSVGYSCSCDVCGFKFEFEHTEDCLTKLKA